MSRSWWPLWWP